MEQKNQTLEQRAKAAAKDQKSQAWKVAVVSALGLTVGAGTTYAAIHHPTSAASKEEEKEDKVATNSTSKHPTTKEASHTTDYDEHNGGIPKYMVYDQETVILPNGSQVQVAMGVTVNGTNCAIVDNDMDGKANVFYEDVNHDGLIENCEMTDLAKNDIAISMDHLPSIDVITIVDPVEPEPLAYVVDEDPAVIVDGSDDVIDAEINPEKEMSDITDSYGLASTGDMTTDDGTDNFMA